MTIQARIRRGILPLTVFAILLASVQPTTVADEGQWPLSMLDRLDLKKAGLEIDPAEIYSPGKPGLIDAICRVGGATGSFVSERGLILTNHHVAFDAVSAVSTVEQNHLRDGFMAATLADELQAPGYVCQITVGYEDVSKEVLAAITDEMSPAERGAAVSAKRQEIANRAKQENPGQSAEVAEMFQGRNYVLFRYQEIQDVRLVCVPPRAVGEYGGENDNWIWPRHTGDFAFMRAYVGPDGKPAPFSKDNVPYEPVRHLQVEPEGVDEGDFVFLLGYPGRTYRHQCADFINHEEQVRMPYIADFFEERIARLEKASEDDAKLALELGPTIKGLANTSKNYRGKLLGLRRLKLVDKRRNEEEQLASWIGADEKRRETYGHVLPELAEIYEEFADRQLLEFAFWRIRQQPAWRFANYAMQAREEMEKPEDERRPAFQSAGIENVLSQAAQSMADRPAWMIEEDMSSAVAAFIALPESVMPEGMADWAAAFEGENALEQARVAVKTSGILSEEGRKAMLEPSEEVNAMARLAAVVNGALAEASRSARNRRGKLDELMALYVDARQKFQAKDFVPDANFTLRLTYGHIRSYEPRDGVLYHPFTTLAGMLAKDTGEVPFDAPKKLRELHEKGDLGRWKDEKIGDVPVGILYDCDTTGGNSGSPVMNAKGHLVGVNFDRAYEATINDFQWSQDYSRSIGVDVRYVLFITEKLMGADRVIDELLTD